MHQSSPKAIALLPPSSVAPSLNAQDAMETAREVAAFCARNAGSVDCDGAFPVAELERIAEGGLLAVPLARSLGGLGWGAEPGGMVQLLRLLSILGESSLTVARLYEGHVNALLLIQLFGLPRQTVDEVIDPSRARLLHAVWNTEDDDGARLLPLGDGRFHIAGAKTFASGAGFVERPLVTARLPDGGWQMVLLDLTVERPAVDQRVWHPIGMKATASGRIDFTGMTVSRDAFVGQPGDYYRQPWFGAGAVRFAAAQLGGAIGLVEAARADLRASGRTDDEAQRRRLGQISIELESGTLLVERAGQLADRSRFGGMIEPTVDDRTMNGYADLVRTAIERICLNAIEYAQRSVGVRSLISPHPIERISRDLAIYLRQPAPDVALRNVGELAFASAHPMHGAWGRTW